MKNNLRLLFVTMLFLFVTKTSFGHALWISSAPVGKLGEKHSVDIYYGEYNLKEFDLIEKWYSDVNEVKVWLVSPSGKKEELTLTNEKNHFHTSFSPNEKGIYTLQVSHGAKQLAGSVKYQFSSTAFVAVDDKKSNGTALSENLSIYVQPKVYKKDEAITLKVFNHGQAYKDGLVEINGPDGWSKTIKVNESGEVTFVPLWSGQYVIETTSYEEKPGEWHSKAYTHIWSSNTNTVLVK